MGEPRRLLEDGPSALERALLHSGMSYRCSADSRLRTMAAVGLAGSTALTAAAAGIAGTSWLAKIGWVKLTLGVSVLGALTAVPLGYLAWQRHSVPAAALTVPQPKPDVDEPKVIGAPEAMAPTDAPLGDATTSTDAVATAKLGPGTRAEAKSELPQSSGLAGELAALDAARALLSKGDPSGALARLDSYNRSYPRGRLKLEAEVLRINALNRSGQVVLARQHGEAFLRKYPNSILASRVRSLLGP